VADIVLIAGTHHGGWYWDSLAEQLRKSGNNVFAPTLTGLDRDHRLKENINLDTHINDVLKIIIDNNLQDLTLVASSYGGMVITGVAERNAATVESMIYLDAALPQPGESEWDLIPENLQKLFTHSTSDGINIDVPADWLKVQPRLAPHPLATKLQPLHYSELNFRKIKKVYVHAQWGLVPGDPSIFKECYEHCANAAGWVTYSLAAGHDLAREAEEAILQIITEHLPRSN
jgi:pimeloyl-ACP methyl ester carboxylesterase